MRIRGLVEAERHLFRLNLGRLAAEQLRIPPGVLWPRGDPAQLVDHVEWGPWQDVPPPLDQPAGRRDRRAVRAWNERNARLAGQLVDPLAYRVRTYRRPVDLRAWRAVTARELGWDSAWHWDPVHGYLHGRQLSAATVVELPRFDHAARPHLVGVGEDEETGAPVAHDLSRDPHGIWTGRTRQGKTTALHLYCHHAVLAGHQALVIVDPDGDQFRAYRDLTACPWQPDDCTGVVVASYADATIDPDDGTVSWPMAEPGDRPDLARAGAYRLRPTLRTLEAVERERARRQEEVNALGLDDDDTGLFDDRWITVVLDESPSLFRPDPVPKDPGTNEPVRVRAARMRNGDRAQIVDACVELATRAGKRRISLVYGAQSARVQGLGGGEAAHNFGWRAIVGKAGTRERRITFDEEPPESPAGQGRVIAVRPAEAPGFGADEYVRLKGYLLTRARELADLAAYRTIDDGDEAGAA